MSIDLNDQQFIFTAKKVELGFATERELNILSRERSGKNVSDLLVLQFRNECLNYIRAMCLKIIERSPLKYRLTKGISSFSPNLISLHPTVAKSRFKALLNVLVDNQRLGTIEAEECRKQFSDLVACSALKSSFESWSEKNDRLDHFYHRILIETHFSYPPFVLSSLIKKVLILSYGNAAVESRFSIDKEFLIENLLEEALVNLRFLIDQLSIQLYFLIPYLSIFCFL